MRLPHVWLCCLWIALVATTPAPAAAQALYGGAGLGPTILLDKPVGTKTTYWGISGVVGLEWPTPIGLRLEGTEVYGFLWLSADLTYRLADRSRPLQSYAVTGAGFRIDVGNSDPIGTAGAGVRAKLSGPLSLFGEGRVHHVLSREPTRTFLFLTVGVLLTP